MSSSKRKLRNYLLDPNLQIVIGLMSVITSLIFALLISAMVYLNLNGFYDLVLELTDLEVEIRSALEDYTSSLAVWVISAVIVYVVFNVALNIYFTHRLIGPTYAFRRHVRALIEGNYQSKVSLRKNDAFVGLADDLNELAEKMNNQTSGGGGSHES